jgi:cell division protein FtsZ
VIPNDRLLAVTEEDTSFKEAFKQCDEVLLQAVKGISELITTQGLINIDYADIKAILQDAGSAFMGIGTATGQNRAHEAALAAINSPLLDIAIDGAKGVLFAISGSSDLKMQEVHEAAKIITESIDPNAKVIFGAIEDDGLKKGELKVTVIATGFSGGVRRRDPLESVGTPADAKRDTEDSPSQKAEKEARKPKKKLEVIEDFDDTPTQKMDELYTDDDWGAVPAFLRRGKK